jgi:hypothetical protein
MEWPCLIRDVLTDWSYDNSEILTQTKKYMVNIANIGSGIAASTIANIISFPTVNAASINNFGVYNALTSAGMSSSITANFGEPIGLSWNVSNAKSVYLLDVAQNITYVLSAAGTMYVVPTQSGNFVLGIIGIDGSTATQSISVALTSQYVSQVLNSVPWVQIGQTSTLTPPQGANSATLAQRSDNYVSRDGSTPLLGGEVPLGVASGTFTAAVQPSTNAVYHYQLITNIGQQLPGSYPANVFLNGWGSFGHVGLYEAGVNQGRSFGFDSGNTNGYSNPVSAFDGDQNTSASAILQHTHQYAGCVWGFTNTSAPTIPTQLTLNVTSEVPFNGENGIIVTLRSAGMWYSVDAGSSWTQIYDSGTRGKQTDSIALPFNTDPSLVQVMAFMDSHDDMGHYVYEVQLTVTPPTGVSSAPAPTTPTTGSGNTGSGSSGTGTNAGDSTFLRGGGKYNTL